jgi:hypothetical protein
MLHGRIGPVVLTQVLPGHGEATFELYLQALDKELVQRPRTSRFAVVYHVPSGGTWSAQQRTRVNRVLDAHLEKRRATTTVWLLCTPSAATRGVVTAMSWLSKPPYPYNTHPSLAAGLAEVRQHHPEITERELVRELEKLTGVLRVGSRTGS